jgi:hypothetical protein
MTRRRTFRGTAGAALRSSFASRAGAEFGGNAASLKEMFDPLPIRVCGATILRWREQSDSPSVEPYGSGVPTSYI